MTMRFNPQDLWQIRRLPGRVNRQEAALLLGFTGDDVSCLVAHKLLKPLADPTQGMSLWFASVEISALCRDTKWLSKATKAVRDTIKVKNDRRRAEGISKP